MDESMIERVARAIERQMASDDNYPEDIARAVLAEMREPTIAMFCRGDEAIIASLDDIPRQPQMENGTPAERCWRAMTDAALAEG